MRLLEHGILARAVLVTLFTSLLASVASIAYTVSEANHRHEIAIQTQLNQSVDTVLATLKTACFLKDADLAGEVAKGLLSNVGIQRVKVEAGTTSLVDLARPAEESPKDNLGWKVLRRTVESPFKAEDIVGVVTLYPNPAVIDGLRRQDVEMAIKQLVWQLLFVSFLVFLALSLLFVRPVRRISDELHHMDATQGQRLNIPASHGNTEIGQLVRDINGLAENLVSALDEARQAKTAAEDASRAKSAFLATMSHEIRTPLNAINGLTHLLRKSGLNPEQSVRLEQLDKAGRHLMSTINAILDLSKIEASKLTLEEAPFSVQEAVRNVRAMLLERASEKALQLDVEVQNNADWLVGDVTRIQQSLLNLGGNAIKFTEHGAVSIRVSSNEEADAWVMLRFEVSDTGIGIAPESLGRLFHDFEQADKSISRKYGGSGLGLALCRKLANLMGGEAGASSQLGRGSTFWFTARLRKAVAQKPESLADSEQAACRALREEHGGKRVLLVDDEPINSEIAKAMLEEAGLQVDLAEDGLQALDKIAQTSYALVLMDMQMPNMNGLEATAIIRLRSELAAMPIIAMTANAFAEDRRRCLDVGMNDFVGKPFEPVDLYQAALRCLV